MNILAIQPTANQTMQSLYETVLGQWAGCHWQTAFGPLCLNLQGVRSRQAHLMAEATSGEEAAAWDEAKRWLSQVEADSITAMQCGKNAVLLAADGRCDDALSEAQKAVALESKYRDPVAWKPLRDAIVTSSPK